MKRFIDLRGQHTGYRFAWFCTVLDRFETFDGDQAWDTWEEFKLSYYSNEINTTIGRYRRLCPEWAKEASMNDREDMHTMKDSADDGSPCLWKRIAERIKSASLAKEPDQLTLAEGEKVVVTFIGDPWVYEAAWHDEQKQWVPAERSPVPVEPAMRVRINVYVEGLHPKMKWWEMDTDTFMKLDVQRRKYGLDEWTFEIGVQDISSDGSCAIYYILPFGKLDKGHLTYASSLPAFHWE